MITWQPVETAPKDGRAIMIFVPSRAGYVADQRFMFAFWCGWGGGVWETTSGGGKWSDWEVTHWMPLPEPPK